MTNPDDYGACIVAIPTSDGYPCEVDGGPHITLAYFGDNLLFTPGDYEYVNALLKDVASRWRDRQSEAKVNVFGVTKFGDDAVVLELDPNPNTPIVFFREEILRDLNDNLKQLFVEAETFPNYRPHVSMGYISKGFEFDPNMEIPQYLTIKELAVWNGIERKSYSVQPNSEILHYGILRKSGRYPWGSGEDPYQRSMDFFVQYDMLKKKGLNDSQIAKQLGMKSTTELRATNAIAKNQKQKADESQALRLKDKGMSTSAIGRKMGLNESSVRALLDPARRARRDVLVNTAEELRKHVLNKTYLDVGLGSETQMGIAKTKLDTAIAMLQDEDFKVHYVEVEQVGMPGKYTKVKVLTGPDVPYSEVYKNRDKIQPITSYSEDLGRTFREIEDPISLDPKRLTVRYGPDGGAKMDGVIELRPGVRDISLGEKRYAQVRILVDDNKYLKGMAIYNPDLPPGIDVRFNTNKEDTGVMLDALKGTEKNLKKDPTNPFGAITRQRHYVDENGVERLSIINRVGSKEGAGEEGGWDWSRNLSSQMLSKQKPDLAKRQLDYAFQDKKAEYDEIMAYTNEAVKKKLLASFADECDSASVHLKAAALPRQKTHVILPMPELKDTEIYAPNYRQGERVVLIRHPHGGTFEIPELTVNNRHPVARERFGNIEDAVVINSKVAEQLSGADFDGDTVIVIPNRDPMGRKVVDTSSPLAQLKGWDAKIAYPKYEGMKKLEGKNLQTEMGKISNLITDMTINEASPSEIARAVKHSMVIIDAEKHELNWEQSAKDQNIRALKAKYQKGANKGAATLISRASSVIRVPERVQRPYRDGGPIDPVTGKKAYVETNAGYDKTTISKSGKESTKWVERTTKSQKMAEVDDARILSSGTAMEEIYANHANQLKALGNQARKSYLNTKNIEYNPSANRVYKVQVDSLTAKLNEALKNKPLERQAQLIAETEVKAALKGRMDLDAADKKKIRSLALSRSRLQTGAEKQRVNIEPKEWEAIQAGAITNNKLNAILDHTDDDVVKRYATPRVSVAITSGKVARAKAMLSNGYTQAEVAQAIGVSTSTLSKALTNG